MTTYYTEAKKGKGKFVYVALDPEQAIQLESQVTREKDGHRLQARIQLHDHNNQFHLTTDGAFELYCEKRKETPRKVYILDTQSQITQVLEAIGYIL